MRSVQRPEIKVSFQIWHCFDLQFLHGPAGASGREPQAAIRVDLQGKGEAEKGGGKVGHGSAPPS